MMIWFILVCIFAIIVIFAIRKAKSHGVASNALLAEHMLGYIELVQENPFTKQLRDAVITVWQNGSNRNISEKDVIESFNRQDRIVQLNLIAIALDLLGHRPMIGKEKWSPVLNPFVNIPSAAQVRSAGKYLENRYDTTVSISDQRLRMLSWGVSDSNDPPFAMASRSMANGPFITGGKKIRSYSCDKYRAVLLSEPKSVGIAKYRFALIVHICGDNDPVLCITAEKSMASKLLHEMPTEMRDIFAGGQRDNVFLGIFDAGGHTNLGPTSDCTSLERFERRALQEMKSRLKLGAAEVEVIAEHGSST